MNVFHKYLNDHWSLYAKIHTHQHFENLKYAYQTNFPPSFEIQESIHKFLTSFSMEKPSMMRVIINKYFIVLLFLCRSN